MKTYLDLFLNEYESAGTRRNYNGTISAMLNAINKDINNITKIDLVEYKNTFKNLAASTQAQKIICIKSYFKFLFDNDVIESNPAEKLSTPRVEHKPKDALTTDEAIMLMHYGNKRERAIIATFLNTGIRVQELIDIKFVDYIKEPSKMVLKTKRGKYRTVYLNDDTIKLINEYLKVRKEGCDNLFVSNQGTPLSEYSLNNTWKKLATKAGINKHITNHSFRSTFVTTIAREHGILMAQMAVNHANIATTRIYVRGMEDEVEAVVRGLKVC